MDTTNTATQQKTQKDTEKYDNVCFDNELSLAGSMNIMLHVYQYNTTCTS